MKEFDVRYSNIVVDDVAGRLIRNPSYGGPSVALNGWHTRPTISNHTKVGFQEALDADIKENGIRNPILVYALPEGIYLTFGGSRLKACINTGRVTCPAIINDYTGHYSDAPEVTLDNWQRYFTDPPRDFEFGTYGADYHYNLERARRHEHDPAGFAWVDGQPSFIKQEFPWVVE